MSSNFLWAKKVAVNKRRMSVSEQSIVTEMDQVQLPEYGSDVQETLQEEVVSSETVVENPEVVSQPQPEPVPEPVPEVVPESVVEPLPEPVIEPVPEVLLEPVVEASVPEVVAQAALEVPLVEIPQAVEQALPEESSVDTSSIPPQTEILEQHSCEVPSQPEVVEVLQPVPEQVETSESFPEPAPQDPSVDPVVKPDVHPEIFDEAPVVVDQPVDSNKQTELESMIPDPEVAVLSVPVPVSVSSLSLSDLESSELHPSSEETSIQTTVPEQEVAPIFQEVLSTPSEAAQVNPVEVDQSSHESQPQTETVPEDAPLPEPPVELSQEVQVPQVPEASVPDDVEVPQQEVVEISQSESQDVAVTLQVSEEDAPLELLVQISRGGKILDCKVLKVNP